MLTLLKIFSLPKMLWSFVADKPNIALSYFMIACIIVLGAFSVTQWAAHKLTEIKLSNTETSLANIKTENTALKGDILQVQQINQAQDEEIKSLKDQQALDTAKLAKNSTDIDVNKRKVKAYEDRLKHLETTSPEFRALSNTALPDEYSSMLNSTQPKARTRNKSSH